MRCAQTAVKVLITSRYQREGRLSYLHWVYLWTKKKESYPTYAPLQRHTNPSTYYKLTVRAVILPIDGCPFKMALGFYECLQNGLSGSSVQGYVRVIVIPVSHSSWKATYHNPLYENYMEWMHSVPSACVIYRSQNIHLAMGAVSRGAVSFLSLLMYGEVIIYLIQIMNVYESNSQNIFMTWKISKANLSWI